MTTTPCVSLSTGTLRPDQRVNYAYGMVLGLDEFLTEQLYLVSRDHSHDRGLHGFGTVSGLAVSVAPVGTDYQVLVTTGTGIDQWGRQFVIDCDQCARIGDWAAAQELAQPGVLAAHTGPSGEVTVHVVAAYDECLDNMVPLPGQPCSSSEQAMVASRLRDAWNVSLRWDAPDQARWDSDRRLARLLAGVTVVAGLPPTDSDEDAIADAVRDLVARTADGGDDLEVPGVGSPPATPAWRLPAETAADALDRILAVWVTEVRPELELDLEEPGDASDPAVLLSTITFLPDPSFTTAAPVIAACDDPDDAGRPFLLHTQLIQELRSFRDVVPEPPAQLVTLTAASSLEGLTTIDAWFHTPDPVLLPGSITVTDELGTDSVFGTSAVDPDAAGFATRWTLTSPGEGTSSTDGLQVSALFPATTVLVGDASTTLGDFGAEAAPILDRSPTGDVVAYAEVCAAVPPAEIPPAVIIPPVELVDIETVMTNVDQVILELWFHLQPRGVKDDTFVVEPAFTVWDDVTGQRLRVALSGPSPWSRNVWRIAIRGEVGDGLRQYLRFQFDTFKFGIETESGDQMALADWIAKAGLVYEGWDPANGDVVVFDLAPAPPEVAEKFPDLFDDHRDLPPREPREPREPGTGPVLDPRVFDPGSIVVVPLDPGLLRPRPLPRPLTDVVKKTATTRTATTPTGTTRTAAKTTGTTTRKAAAKTTAKSTATKSTATKSTATKSTGTAKTAKKTSGGE